MGKIKKKINKKFSNINSITLKPLFRKIIGWDEIEERNSAIHYYLNNYFDICKFPKAEGLLRKVQLADAELLRIVTDILSKHNLSYWLDYGTLLGAVRHKGFIPWDDDLDIAMPRKDYDIALEVFPKEFEIINHDNNLTIKCSQSKGRILISMYKAGLILDIVPYDNVSANKYSSSGELQKSIAKCRYNYRKKPSCSQDVLQQRREKMIGEYVNDNPVWFQCPEWGQNDRLYVNEVIFPLKKIRFEDYEFSAPNDYKEYLTIWYGDYMAFPKTGVLHHNASGNGIHNNSIKHKINIDEIIELLKRVNVYQK